MDQFTVLVGPAQVHYFSLWKAHSSAPVLVILSGMFPASQQGNWTLGKNGDTNCWKQ